MSPDRSCHDESESLVDCLLAAGELRADPLAVLDQSAVGPLLSVAAKNCRRLTGAAQAGGGVKIGALGNHSGEWECVACGVVYLYLGALLWMFVLTLY
jgi:hypothetical protein